MYHIPLHPRQQFLKGFMPLGAIHHQRIPLPVGVQANAGTQVFHRRQVVDPMQVNGPQQQQPFQRPHRLRPQFRLPGRIDRFGVIGQDRGNLLSFPLQDRFLGGQFRRRRANQHQLRQESGNIPIIAVAVGQVFPQQVGKLLAQHFDNLFPQIVALEDAFPVGVDDFPLGVQHIVKVQQMLADIEMVALHLDLGAADGLGNQLVLNGNVGVHSAPAHHRLDAVAAKALHQFILEGHIELGTARIPLAAGAAAQLIVNAAGVVMFGAEDMETAQGHDLVVFGPPFRRIPVGIAAAEDNIGAAAGHIGGDGNGF